MSDSSITVAELEILHREKALNPLLVTAWEGETNIDHILRSIRLYPESWRRFCILGTATIIFALLAIFFGLLKGKAPPQNYIDTATVKSITDDHVVFCLVSNTSLFGV